MHDESLCNQQPSDGHGSHTARTTLTSSLSQATTLPGLQCRFLKLSMIIIMLLQVLHDDIRYLLCSRPPSLAFHKFLSRIQLSHNLAFPMTTWQLSLNLALDPCLDTPIKDTCIRSNHIILTEIYEIPCLLRLIFFRRLSSGDWCL